ncbi:ABC transporter permease [Calothrix sp. UHCC 0171]|uniref:ABC transporter permease n=1 Tax=Calothrix sp. UHCC 0171 TaxID=3110245 RepID=UPI002B202563|nr:ABC transporter permease [Calothrix sp. UHCC 0171]MEA5571123.1 ABC transporter permease [Calothrix sp. UHCC 0171]
MQRILNQCIKELKQFRRDKLTVALAFALPLITLLLFGFAIRLETKNIPLAIQDFEGSSSSRAYIERLFATNQFQPVKLSNRDSLANPNKIIDSGLAKAVVIIPPEFSDRIHRSQQSPIQVLVDGTDGNNARVIKNSIRATTRFFLQNQGLLSLNNLIIPRIRLWFNPGRKESLYIVPGVFAVNLWIFLSLLSAIAMVREKEQGTILQIYSTSLSARELLLGKGLAYLIIGLIQAIFLIIPGIIIFQLWFAGNPIPLLVTTPIYLSASVLFGLFMGCRTNTQSAAVQGVATTGFLTAYLLSGFIYPVDNIPFPLSLVSYIVPARYYILITRDAFVRGTGWGGIWHVPLILIGFCLLLFIGCDRILWRMQFSDNIRQINYRDTSIFTKNQTLNHVFSGRLWSLIIKEIKQTLGNRQLIFLLIFPATIQLLVFGFALSPDVNNLKLGIVDYSQTPASRELIAAFTKNHVFKTKYHNDNQTQLAKQVREGNITAGLVIPPELNRNIRQGKSTDIQILIDAVDANTAGIASGYASQIVSKYNQILNKKNSISNLTFSLIEPQINILYNPGLISSWFLVPGVLGLVLTLMSSLVAAAALVREKESGTLEQLLMTPASDWEILLAKVAPLFLLLILDVFLALGISRLIFHLPFRGNFPLFLLLSSLAIFVGISIGLFLATISPTQIRTQLTAFFINMPLNTLSGTVTPIESMPVFFQYLSWLNPLRHYVAIIRGILLKGVGLEVLYPHAIALAFFAIILLAISSNKFRNQLS